MRYTIHVAFVYVCVDIDIHVTVVPSLGRYMRNVLRDIGLLTKGVARG